MKTRRVRVHLSALTRVYWTAIVEVPEELSDKQVVYDVDRRIGGGEYEEDEHYWQQEEGFVEEAGDDEAPVYRLNAAGQLKPIEKP